MKPRINARCAAASAAVREAAAADAARADAIAPVRAGAIDGLLFGCGLDICFLLLEVGYLEGISNPSD